MANTSNCHLYPDFECGDSSIAPLSVSNVITNNELNGSPKSASFLPSTRGVTFPPARPKEGIC